MMRPRWREGSAMQGRRGWNERFNGKAHLIGKRSARTGKEHTKNQGWGLEEGEGGMEGGEGGG